MIEYEYISSLQNLHNKERIFLTKINTRKLVLSSFFLALGILLPQISHMFGGKEVGSIFLPMHIPVLLSGFITGPLMGLYIGILTPVLSHIITGMPPMSPVPILPMMIFELAAYGLLSGILYQKLKQNIFISLLGAMVGGRIVYGIVMSIIAHLFHIELSPISSVLASIVSGLPGIALQFVLIPALIQALKIYQRKNMKENVF